MEGIHRENRPRLAGVVASLLALGLVTAACGDGASADDNPPITIGYTAWPEDIAVTYLWQGILEDRGYDVTISQRRVESLFAKMAGGDIDLFMDTWLPRTHADYWRTYKDQLGPPTKWYNAATLELAVPNYMKAESIGDLHNYSEELGGKIVGIELGAGETTIIKRRVLPAYNLRRDFRYVSSSTAGMLAALEGAINNRAPIVVALWHPHLAYLELPIKDLDDPKGAWGQPEGLWVTSRQEFNDDRPQVWGWLEKFHMSEELLDSLLIAVVQEAHSPQGRRAAVDAWIGAHRDVVSAWAGPAD